MVYIMSVLYSYHPAEKVRVVPSRLAAQKPEAVLGDNIIVIGGPVANDLARMLIERTTDWQINSPFCFHRHQLTYGGNDVLKTSYATSGDPYSMTEDYGCIVHRQLKLWGKDRRLWLLMGCHTYGTYGTALACFSDDFCAALLKSSQKDYYNVVVEVKGLDAISKGDGEVSVSTRQVADLPAIGPIDNPADVDAVLRSLTLGLQLAQAARKRLAHALLALALVALCAPYVIKFFAFFLWRR